MDRYPSSLEVFAQKRVSANVICYFAHAGKQTLIVERRLVCVYPVEAELSRLSEQASSLSQRSHRHWAVVCGHSAERVARDECRSSCEACGAKPQRPPPARRRSRERRTHAGARKASQ